MVKRVWFRDYDPNQFDRRSMTIVQSWDTALKGDPSSDYSVGTTWAKDDNNYYLLDLVRVRAAYPDLIKAVKNSLLEHSPDIILIEDAGSGSSLIADSESQDISTTPVKARTDKESRLSRVAAGKPGHQHHAGKSQNRQGKPAVTCCRNDRKRQRQSSERRALER
ncbi:hypothetical protein [Mesorhizobium sp. LSHC412B00]|uniref:phage terminase large subunit family protein n=1 Tax=Mesorhizobium sp. LSHC412B00 TaxID=1287285 RepID=UPI0012EB9BE8|nr:hypothetical protein [Mesorhizobium sp. LSHC412B00]